MLFIQSLIVCRLAKIDVSTLTIKLFNFVDVLVENQTILKQSNQINKLFFNDLTKSLKNIFKVYYNFLL